MHHQVGGANHVQEVHQEGSTQKKPLSKSITCPYEADRIVKFTMKANDVTSLVNEGVRRFSAVKMWKFVDKEFVWLTRCLVKRSQA